MFRVWFKQVKDNRMVRDMVIERPEDDMSRTKKIFTSLNEVCEKMDLAVPIWLDSTINDFKKHSKARFYQDSFTETINFDYLEIHVIEE